MSDEEGITNFGRIRSGLSFSEATAETIPQRKYHINPYNGGHRLTLCETLRQTWKLLDGMQDGEAKETMRMYLSSAFDYAKRMDARMKELKGILDGK